ncbi:MAG: FABP family protein [Acidimicrobiia bacterium]|nr:FABP family protein [Acidimicrobiia bacterium]
MTPPLHVDIEHLAWLVGSWTGGGAGRYPTIESFEYVEQVEFGHVGKPFLSYVQRTKHAETGLPLHAESGYIRPVDLDRAELVVAQPSGIIEVHQGVIDGQTISFQSVSVITTATAKDVAEVHRTLTVEGNTLSYTVDMAAVGLELQHHLAATLHRN